MLESRRYRVLSIGQRPVLNDAQIPDFDPACSGAAGPALASGHPRRDAPVCGYPDRAPVTLSRSARLGRSPCSSANRLGDMRHCSPGTDS
jgi:hypothetical protein